MPEVAEQDDKGLGESLLHLIAFLLLLHELNSTSDLHQVLWAHLRVSILNPVWDGESDLLNMSMLAHGLVD